MRSKAVRLLLFGPGIALLAYTGFYMGRTALYAMSAYKPGATEPAYVEVRRGEGNAEIARSLEAGGVIASHSDFLLLGRLTRRWRHLKVGEYEVTAGMSPWQIFARLSSGISVNHPITVREGENLYEIAADMASKKLTTKEAFLTTCRDPKFLQTLGLGIPAGKYASLEGYLFPETYFFNRAMSLEEMIRQMTRKFQAEWTPERDSAARALGLTRHQIVTLASVVEKETGHPQERPLIASVFYNRLKRHMPLQSDPTTIYGMWTRYAGNIHKSDLKDPNPYNTYYVPALPVGPIANPGIAAIEATLHPASSNYLYFVSHNDGTTEFSATLEAHNHAVQKYQVDPNARVGKSWRDLSQTLRIGRAQAPKAQASPRR